jgi:hypothetical protein
MPVHDWSRVPSGLFHHFHQVWTTEIAGALNRGLLPKGISALVEQRTGAREADVLALKQFSKPLGDGNGNLGGVATATPPVTRFVERTTANWYARKANRVAIKHHLGRTIAVIEIVSPGNKDSRGAVREFVDKTVQYLQQGVHMLVVDLLPPTPRDPQGLHQLIWSELCECDFAFPPGKDRLLVSYETDQDRVAYIEPVGVGTGDLPNPDAE